MTVESIFAPVQYAGDGSSTGFAFSYSFFDPADLKVTLFNTSTNGNVTPAPARNGAATYDYTVTGTRDAETGEYLSGATVTFNTAPPAGYRVVLERNVSARQTVALTDNGPLPAKTIEGALDRATMVIQQLGAIIARSVAAPAADPAGAALELPPISARAGQFLAFDDAGNLTAATPAGAGTPISAPMQPVVAAATVQNAFDLIALNGGTIGNNVEIDGNAVITGTAAAAVLTAGTRVITAILSAGTAAIDTTLDVGGPVNAPTLIATRGTIGTLIATTGSLSGALAVGVASLANHAAQFAQTFVGDTGAWADYTSSRAMGTTYTNSYGRPIAISVSASNSVAAQMLGWVDGLNVVYGPFLASGAGILFVVPPGKTYSASYASGSPTLISWKELH